jgi:serine protease Do
MGRFHLHRLLIALAAVTALVAPVYPATSAAAPADTAAPVQPAVVQIDTTIDYQNAFGMGAGFVLSPGGEVLTNYHVVQGADVITAHNVGTGRNFPVDLIGYDRGHDIALVQLRGAAGLPTAPLGNSDQVAVGDQVVTIGNAGGLGSPPTHESGNVTDLNRTIDAKDALTGASDKLTGLIEVAANVRAGDSGGPLVNGAGQVVGVTTAATVNYRFAPGGEGFAIPINQALAIADQIRSRVPSESVHIGPPTLLGVGVAASEQPEGAPGVVIREALRGGPAEQAGLVGGDVLTSIDGTPLDSATTLTYVLDRHYPGDVVDLMWIDGAGQQRTGKATLTAGP